MDIFRKKWSAKRFRCKNNVSHNVEEKKKKRKNKGHEEEKNTFWSISIIDVDSKKEIVFFFDLGLALLLWTGEGVWNLN